MSTSNRRASRASRASRSSKSEISFMNATEVLAQLPLKRFCTRKLHEVEFVYPYTFCDSILLQQIVDTGKNYEHISGVYFITFEDVLNLIDRLAQTSVEVDLPKRIEKCARHFVTTELDKMSSMSLGFLAIMTKLKIMESMYQVYRTEVINMQQKKQVYKQLDELLLNCEPTEKGKKDKKDKNAKKDNTSNKNSKGKQPKESKSKNTKTSEKSLKSTNKNVESKEAEVINDDYTDIVLEENETIFDYNVDNHLQYFVLTGFSDPLLIRELINLSVYVSAVIDVSLKYSHSVEPENIILKLQELFETPKTTSYLENTVWMKYRCDCTTTPKATLEEFLFVVKRINFIKRQHLAYIKKLKLCNLGPTSTTEDFECFEKYNRILNSFPPELINIPLIVNTLVKGVCWRDTDMIYSESDLTPSTESEDSNIPKPPKSFQAHEEDYLKIGMLAYHETGRRCYDQSLEYFKLLQPLAKVDHCEQVGFRSIEVSTDDSCICDNTKELFDYFHLAIFSQMKRKQFKPRQPQQYYFTKNLVTHNQVKAYEKALPKCDVIYKDDKNDLLYNYRMKEDLSSTVLFQLIFRAMNDYSSWDRYYCDISNAVLLRFHDNLTDFGIDTKFWDQNLPTPTCLRDFCRFLVNEEKHKQWLVKYKLTDHAELNLDENEKECDGLIDMHIPEMYEEYNYLLGVVRGVTREEKKKTFDDVLTELMDYPKSEVLTSYCSNDGTFDAYNLGPQLCQLTGHTTIFHSDDGVKITVDTSRFMVEDPKCSVTIDADSNSFVFHNNSPSAFHFILKDETIVSFSEFDTTAETPSFIIFKAEIGDNYQYESEVDVEGGEEHQEEEKEEGEGTKLPNYNDYWIQVLRKSKMNTTIPKVFDKPTISDRKVEIDDRNLNRLLELFKAAVYLQRPIYKISTKPSVRRLKRIGSPWHVPLVACLKRVLFKPSRKKRRIGGYSVLNIPRTKNKVPLKYDFNITLPNGLLITTLPRNKTFAEIKQEYKYKHYKELYRIYYSAGVVVVKHFDGTTTIMCSNGDIIKLTDESECFSANCVENMTQTFQHKEEENCPYRISRSGESPKATTVDTPFINLYEFGDIPYTRKTLLQFDGKRIDVSKDRIYEKQVYYVLNEHDYHTEEIFYEREDGMKCIADKRGKMTFQFPDGTKITSWAEFEKELIFVSKKTYTEGWVSVVINYKFEHPEYITVEYLQADLSTSLFLKDSVVKNFQNSCLISANKNIALEVTSDDITFLKSCDACDGDCICKIHIAENNTKLFEIFDSYEKHLVCDRLGQWEINSNFIKTPLNKNKCNHRWKNEKQKFFIVNERGPPGTLLWKDSFVENKVVLAKNMKHIKVANYMNKLLKRQTVEFFTEVYQNFVNMFTMTCKQRDLCLAKHKKDFVEKPQVYYVTYRILLGFQNMLHDPNILVELKAFLESRSGGGDFIFLSEGLKHLVSYAFENGKTIQETLSFLQCMNEVAETTSSSETKSFELPKIPVEEIIAKWRAVCEKYRHLIRNKIFPPYFHSEYHLNVLK